MTAHVWQHDEDGVRYCGRCGFVPGVTAATLRPCDGEPAVVCDVCGRTLDPEKGEAFLTDDGGTFCNDDAPNHEVDMDEVCRILDARHGVYAYVEQTGGGTATIYAGEPNDIADGERRYPAIAGPGWFEGPGWMNARGDTRDFYIGPDDDGEADPMRPAPNASAADIAAMIADEVRKGNA